jgi:hypothetical protein
MWPLENEKDDLDMLKFAADYIGEFTNNNYNMNIGMNVEDMMGLMKKVSELQKIKDKENKEQENKKILEAKETRELLIKKYKEQEYKEIVF